MAQESRSGLFHLETQHRQPDLCSQGLWLSETVTPSPSRLHAEYQSGPPSKAGFLGPLPPQFDGWSFFPRFLLLNKAGVTTQQTTR